MPRDRGYASPSIDRYRKQQSPYHEALQLDLAQETYFGLLCHQGHQSLCFLIGLCTPRDLRVEPFGGPRPRRKAGRACAVVTQNLEVISVNILKEYRRLIQDLPSRDGDTQVFEFACLGTYTRSN